eukprot:4858463-Amphidinium_carterae.1
METLGETLSPQEEIVAMTAFDINVTSLSQELETLITGDIATAAKLQLATQGCDQICGLHAGRGMA